MSPVLSPSDLIDPGEGQLLLGGRVMQTAPQWLVLADALDAVRVLGRAEPQLSVGDLVILAVRRDAQDGRLRLLSVVDHRAYPEPRVRGEHLRLSASGRGRHLRQRARALQIIRNYFLERRFIEVDTPTLVPCPGLDPHVSSLGAIDENGAPRYLITSPEFHMKRLIAGGMPRIFQFAHCFRKNESGPWHESQFTLLEWYRAFSGYQEVLEDTEELVWRVFQELRPGLDYPGGLVQRPFMRVTVREAFQLAGLSVDPIALAEQDPDDYFQLLVDRVEPALAALGRPVFLTHYPLSQGALAQACPQDPSVAERFELYLGETELSNGYGELTDAQAQRERFELEIHRRDVAKEESYPLDERFLDALHEGLPPAAGNALGVDRLVALALGTTNIQEVLSFSASEK